MTPDFDTLAVARKLQAAGFPEGHAEAVTGVMCDSRSADLSVLVAKTDLVPLAADNGVMKTDLGALKTDVAGIRTDVAGLKTDVSAFKADVVGVKSDLVDLRADLRQTESRLEAKIEIVESDILRWTIGAIGLQTVVIVGTAIPLARLYTR